MKKIEDDLYRCMKRIRIMVSPNYSTEILNSELHGVLVKMLLLSITEQLTVGK